MPQNGRSYTYEELIAMGAVPVAAPAPGLASPKTSGPGLASSATNPPAAGGSYSYEELIAMGATPAETTGADFRLDTGVGVETPDNRSLTERFISAITPTTRDAFRGTGAAVGGMLGGTAGTVFGTPVGAVPGAIAGGGAGGAAGEALYQILQHLGMFDGAPETSSEAMGGINEALIAGGIQEGIGAGMTGSLPGALRRGAAERTAGLLHPSTLAQKASTQRIAGEIAPEIPVRMSPESLLRFFTGQRGAAQQALNRAYGEIPEGVRFGTKTIRDALQRGRSGLQVQGAIAPGTAPKARAYDQLIRWFDEHPFMTIGDLRQNRQLWDEIVNWGRAPGANIGAKEEVFKESADLMRGLINDSFPNVADANHAYWLWNQASDILGRSELGQVGRSGPGLIGSVTGGTGAVVGAVLGGPEGGLLGASTGGVLGYYLTQLAQHQAWKTLSVAGRTQIAKILERQGYEAALRALESAATQRGTSLTMERVTR